MSNWEEEAIAEFAKLIRGEKEFPKGSDARMALETLFVTEAGSYSAEDNVRILFEYAGQKGWGEGEEYKGIVITNHFVQRKEEMDKARH